MVRIKGKIFVFVILISVAFITGCANSPSSGGGTITNTYSVGDTNFQIITSTNYLGTYSETSFFSITNNFIVSNMMISNGFTTNLLTAITNLTLTNTKISTINSDSKKITNTIITNYSLTNISMFSNYFIITNCLNAYILPEPVVLLISSDSVTNAADYLLEGVTAIEIGYHVTNVVMITDAETKQMLLKPYSLTNSWYFSNNIPLVSGTNRVIIRAYADNGRIYDDTNYIKNLLSGSVMLFNSPFTNGAVTNIGSFTMDGTYVNFGSVNTTNIKVKINGNAEVDLPYTGFNWSLNVSGLKQGVNKILFTTYSDNGIVNVTTNQLVIDLEGPRVDLPSPTQFYFVGYNSVFVPVITDLDNDLATAYFSTNGGSTYKAFTNAFNCLFNSTGSKVIYTYGKEKGGRVGPTGVASVEVLSTNDAVKAALCNNPPSGIVWDIFGNVCTRPYKETYTEPARFTIQYIYPGQTSGGYIKATGTFTKRNFSFSYRGDSISKPIDVYVDGVIKTNFLPISTWKNSSFVIPFGASTVVWQLRDTGSVDFANFRFN